jgi:beta-mannosidase
VDLKGVWRATPADDEIRRSGVAFDIDTGDSSAWSAIDVPGHWRNHPRFASSDGPLVYRREYSLAPPADGRRRWITFDGIFYQADVWLDGAYLGDPEGYFVPTAFDVTALSRLGDDHVLAVEVACPPQSASKKRTITGVFQQWDGIDRHWNPGGIWAPVRVEDTGPVRIDRFRVLCRDTDETRAHLVLEARLDADTNRAARVRTLVDGRAVAESEQSLASGSNDVSWTIDIEQPALWWPRSLGDQPLTDVCLEVVVDGVVSHVAERRTGLREVAWSEWVCSVNGERLFLKGANLLPTRMDLAEATPAEIQRDVELAVEAGLDVLRVHGHIGRPELYDAADRLGILLLQDFPLVAGYARSIRGQAVEQARAAVDVLGHHPSIVLWSAHTDPGGGRTGTAEPERRGRLRSIAGQQLPSWNRTILDRWVKRAFETSDPTRPCVPHSGVLPHLPTLDGTDSHLSFGWEHGDVRDLERTARRIPRVVRFVSEFGAQSVPDTAEFIDISTWPDLDWDHLRDHYGMQPSVFAERVPPHHFATFDEWRHATQSYQAELIRYHVETLRRLKYRPTGGFCVFTFNDSAPAVSWSLLDHQRAPKLALHALTRACAPVIVVADRPPDIVTAGEELRLDLHVVNDLRQALAPAVVTAVVRWAGGEIRQSFSGDVPPDSCVKVGRVQVEVPDTLGALTIDVSFTAGAVSASNHYATVVTVLPD